jgi:predicted transcriptional regulator
MNANLAEIASLCEAELVVGTAETVISAAYTSDLLSDVIANAPADSILITVQNHINTIAVSTLAEIKAVMVCHSREIPDEMRLVAEREKVAVLSTSFNQFQASSRLGEIFGKA